MATSPPASVAPGLSELELQCSSFSVTHTGLVVDLLGESPCSTPAQDVHEELVESLRTPNFKRTKAGADEREKRKQMDNVKWETCTNTVDFEALLKPAIALCAKHKEDMEQEISENSIKGKDKKADYSPSKEWLRKKSERIQFVVTQLRLVGHGGSHSREGIAASCAPYVSKIAFVLVLPSETLSMEGPVLTGTHLSASMLPTQGGTGRSDWDWGQEPGTFKGECFLGDNARCPTRVHQDYAWGGQGERVFQGQQLKRG